MFQTNHQPNENGWNDLVENWKPSCLFHVFIQFGEQTWANYLLNLSTTSTPLSRCNHGILVESEGRKRESGSWIQANPPCGHQQSSLASAKSHPQSPGGRSGQCLPLLFIDIQHLNCLILMVFHCNYIWQNGIITTLLNHVGTWWFTLSIPANLDKISVWQPQTENSETKLCHGRRMRVAEKWNDRSGLQREPALQVLVLTFIPPIRIAACSSYCQWFEVSNRTGIPTYSNLNRGQVQTGLQSATRFLPSISTVSEATKWQ